VRKQALAWLLKLNTVVADEWVWQNLGTGDHSNISRAVGRFRRRKEKPVVELIKSCTYARTGTFSTCLPKQAGEPVGLLLAGLLRRRVEAAAMASSRCHENKNHQPNPQLPFIATWRAANPSAVVRMLDDVRALASQCRARGFRGPGRAGMADSRGMSGYCAEIEAC